MIEIICQYPKQMVFGGAALGGALISAGVSIARKKKEDKNFKFDATKIADTVWQSTLAGVVAAGAIACGYVGILTAMIGGVGIDKICNKLKISEAELLNFISMAGKYLEKKNK